MLKYSWICAIILLAVSAFGLFQIKFHVQDLRKNILELSKRLTQEKESIHVLKAEWTYLNQPERLRELAKKYLQLDAIKMSQIYKLENNLPLFLAEDEVKRELYLASNDFHKANKYSSEKESINKKENNMINAAKFKEINKTKPTITKVKY